MTSTSPVTGATPGPPAAGARRVAMVSVRYPPFVGDVETHVHEVATRLAARGVDVTVLTTDPAGDLRSHERCEGVDVQRFPVWPTSGDPYVAPALVRQLGLGRYDVVHVQGVHTLVPPAALAAARRAGIPAVVTLHIGGHASALRRAVRGARWRLLGRSLRRAEALVAVSRYEVELFSRVLKVSPEGIHFIPDGAQPRTPAPDLPSWDDCTDRLAALYDQVTAKAGATRPGASRSGVSTRGGRRG